MIIIYTTIYVMREKCGELHDATAAPQVRGSGKSLKGEDVKKATYVKNILIFFA